MFTGFSFIVCLTIVTFILVLIRPHKAAPHQAIVSIYWVELFVPTWLLVIGISQTSLMAGAFRSKVLLALREENTHPSAVLCGRGRMLCWLIVGIHASGISILLCLLVLLRWSLTCHSLRKCSRDQRLWSTDWLKLGTEVGCDEIIFISKTTLAHF